MSYPELVGPAKDSPSPPNSLSAAWLDSRRKLGRGHHWFWSSLTAINSGPSWHRAARWTATVCGGLLGCALVLGPSHATLGLLGAQCANVGREEPLRRRTVSMVINALVSLGFFFLGWYAAPYPWLLPPLITAMTFFDRMGVACPDGGPAGAYKHGVCWGLWDLYGLHPFKRTRNNCFG